MASEKSKTIDTYVAGRDSIKKALDFLKSKKHKDKRYLLNGKNKHERIAENCTSSVNLKKNKNPKTIGFSPSYVALQMRTCLMEQDWIGLQRLIPLLLDYSTDREPILWRYALITLLNSPESDENHILDFLERCLGSVSENDSQEPARCLQQLLTIKSNDKE